MLLLTRTYRLYWQEGSSLWVAIHCTGLRPETRVSSRSAQLDPTADDWAHSQELQGNTFLLPRNLIPSSPWHCCTAAGSSRFLPTELLKIIRCDIGRRKLGH